MSYFGKFLRSVRGKRNLPKDYDADSPTAHDDSEIRHSTKDLFWSNWTQSLQEYKEALDHDGVVNRNRTSSADERKASAVKLQAHKVGLKLFWERHFGQDTWESGDQIGIKALKIANLKRVYNTERKFAVTPGRKAYLKDLTRQISTLNDDIDRISRRFTQDSVEVSISFTIYVDQYGRTHPYRFFYGKDGDSRFVANTPKAIENAKFDLLREFENKLMRYLWCIEPGNNLGTIYHLYNGSSPPGTDKKKWHEDHKWSYGTYLDSLRDIQVHVHHSILGRRIVANARAAPDVHNLRSPSYSNYGCVTSGLHEVCGDDQFAISKFLCKAAGIEPYDPLDDVSAEEMKEFYPEIDVRDMGFSPEQVAEFLRTKKNPATIHVPFVETIHIPSPRKDLKHLHFTFMNKHFYIGTPSFPKISFAGRTSVVMNRFQTDDWQELVGQHNIVYIPETITLVDLAQKMINAGQVPNIEAGTYGPSKLLLQDTVFVEDDGYEARQGLVESLNNKFPYAHDFLQGHTQSWLAIANAVVEANNIRLKTSYDNINARRFLRTFKMAPLTRFLNEPTSEPRIIDNKSAYVQVVVKHHDAPIGVFNSSTNYDFVCDDEVEQRRVAQNILKGMIGEALLDEFTVFGYLNKMTAGWPSYWVKILLEKGWISHTHILAWRQCSEKTTAGVLKEAVQCLKEATDDDDDAKTLYTRFFGGLGITETTTTEGMLVNDKVHIAQAKKRGYREQQILDEWFMLYKTNRTQVLENQAPYFRFVVAGSIILLLELVEDLLKVDPLMRICCSRVDSVVFNSALPSRAFEGLMQKKWRILVGTEWVENDRAKWDTFKPTKVLKENHEVTNPEVNDPYCDIMFNQNWLYDGMAGCRKSHFMEEQLSSIVEDELVSKPKILLVSAEHSIKLQMLDIAKRVTNGVEYGKALDNVKVKSDKASITVTIFDQLKARYFAGVLKNKFDYIFIDEFSKMSDWHFMILNFLVDASPGCVVQCFGDDRQCHSANKVQQDINSPGWLTLFPNRKTIEYQFEGPRKGRMDKAQHDANVELVTTRKMNEAFLRRVTRDPIKPTRRSLAFTNQMCAKIDATLPAELRDPKPWIVIKASQATGLVKGMRITDEEKNQLKMRSFAETQNIATCDVVPYSCMTFDRVQGETIDEAINVYELDHGAISLNQAYVGLSRNRNLEQINIVGDVEKLSKKVWRWQRSEIEVEDVYKPQEDQPLLIYHMTTRSKKTTHVGFCHREIANEDCDDVDSALKAMERRLDEHKKDPKNAPFLADDTEMRLVALFWAAPVSVKRKQIETYWIQKLWGWEGYKTINREGAPKPAKPVLNKVEAKRDVKERGDSELPDGLPCIKVDEKAKKVIWEIQRSKRCPVEKKFAVAFTADREDDKRKLVEKVTQWLMTEGIKIEFVKNALIVAGWV